MAESTDWAFSLPLPCNINIIFLCIFCFFPYVAQSNLKNKPDYDILTNHLSLGDGLYIYYIWRWMLLINYYTLGQCHTVHTSVFIFTGFFVAMLFV